MSKPREYHPGQLVMITQSTFGQKYYFPPGEESRELFGYMLGKSCNDHNIDIHVGFLMSNHAHLLVTDHGAKRGAMMQQAFSNIARKRNLELDKDSKIWSDLPPNVMAVLDLTKAIEQTLYIALQAVAAGLIDRVDEWSGFMVLPKHWGTPMRFKRHKYCGDTMPEDGVFTPMPPPGFENLPLPQVQQFFEERIRELEREYAAKRKGPGVGIRACEAMSPLKSPKKKHKRGRRTPTFTTTDPLRVQMAIARQREFRAWHRQARTEFRKGNHDTEFPAGTVQMAKRAGCRCATAAADHPLHYDKTWSHELQSSWDTWLNAQ